MNYGNVLLGSQQVKLLKEWKVFAPNRMKMGNSVFLSKNHNMCSGCVNKLPCILCIRFNRLVKFTLRLLYPRVKGLKAY